MNQGPPVNDSFCRIDAAAAADGRGAAFAPVSVLLGPARTGQSGSRRVLAAIGLPGEVDQHPGASRAARIDRPDCLLIPALVNAHSHLDLTHIGPRPYDAAAGFGSFVDLVRRERRADDDGVRASVARGIALSGAGGVVGMGDIAGAPQGSPSAIPYRTLADSGLAGVSYLEFFAIGAGEQRGRDRIVEGLRGAFADTRDPVVLGVQPHAPTTVSLSTYGWMLRHPELGHRRLSTHLAETPSENEFIAHGRGTHRAFLESLGLWEDRMLEEVGRGRSPVEHMGAVLAQAPFLCAHVNDASDKDIELLAGTPTSVAYCPRASDYFRTQDHFGPHRYRDMLAAGINVCLGTDSIINLPPGTGRLSTLDEARFLYGRDKTDPVTLLKMATINGAKALGLDESAFAFQIGAGLAGIVAVPLEAVNGLTPLAAALSSDSEPELLAVGA
jgi:aminodeoxyfutalosine deaminase